MASRGKSILGIAFVIGLLVSLWSANAGTKSLFDSLNIVYNEDEKRGVIKLNLVSLTLSVAAIIFALFGTGVIVVLPVALNYIGLGAATDQIFRISRWPILFVFVALAIAFIYRYGPSRAKPKWRWITWGSAFAAVAWIAESVVFSSYTANFDSYNQTYGLLGAVIGFMIWLWLSIILILVGGELDAKWSTRPHGTPRPDRPSRSGRGVPPGGQRGRRTALNWNVRSACSAISSARGLTLPAVRSSSAK